MKKIVVMATSTKYLLLLLLCQLSAITSFARRRPSASHAATSCHVTQTGTGCRYALSLRQLGGGASCRHGNVTSQDEVITDKLDDLVVKVTRLMKQLSVRCLRQLRQVKAELRKVFSAMETLTLQQPDARPDTATASGGSNVTVTPSCLPEFSKVGAWPSCYRFSTFNSTWHEAREYCSAFGANLLALDSLKEAHIIDYLLNSKTEYQNINSWWTSGNFMVRNQRWMWTSKHHLKPISYSRWAATAAPAVDGAESQTRMHCLLLDRSLQYHWVEANCVDRHNFVCEQGDHL